MASFHLTQTRMQLDFVTLYVRIIQIYIFVHVRLRNKDISAKWIWWSHQLQPSIVHTLLNRPLALLETYGKKKFGWTSFSFPVCLRVWWEMGGILTFRRMSDGGLIPLLLIPLFPCSNQLPSSHSDNQATMVILTLFSLVGNFRFSLGKMDVCL